MIDIERTLGAAFEQSRTSDPGAEALVFRDERWTFDALHTVAARFAGGLRALGLGRGDRVAVFAPNMPEHVVSVLGCSMLGAIHVGINPQWQEDECRYLLADSGSRVLLASVDTLDVAEAALDGTAVEALVAVPRALDAAHPVPVRASTSNRAIDLADVLGEPLDAPVAADPGDTVALWYTSGTTGRPKGAVWSHRNFLFNGLAWIDAYGLGRDDSCIVAAPIAHNTLGMVTAVMLAGGKVLLCPRFDPAAFLDVVEREAPTVMPTSPTMVKILRQRGAERGLSALPSVTTVPIGSAPSAVEFLRGITEFLPNARIYNSYGASEGVFSLGRPTDPPSKVGSVGTPLTGVELRVVRPDGTDCSPGEIGEVATKGPGNISGYWQRPDAATRLLRDGWMILGDLGYLDDDRYLWLVGRDRDVINCGGYNVYASEVESVLAAVDGVDAVAVVGEVDEVLGERIVAHVVPSAPGAVARPALQAAAQQLAKYKRPSRYDLVAQLPMNELGKVQKHRLTAPHPSPAPPG